MIILRKKIHWLLGGLICVLFIIYQSAIIIPEGHSGLFLLPEKLTPPAKYNLVLNPGLHFTLPLLMQPVVLDNRLQTLFFSKSSEENRSQDKPIRTDYYANWRISDPVLYYKQTKNNIQETKLLITQHITDLFNDQNAHVPYSQLILHGSTTQIDSILAAANKRLKPAGITLATIGFKQLHLSADTNARLLNRMSTEQENSAITQHAEGQANAELIHANADSSVSLILAQAKEEAAKIRAQGDAEAAKIYNQAYNKNPEFAAFYLNLQAYQQGLSPSSLINNSLLLKVKNEPLKLENRYTDKGKLRLTH